MATTTPNYGWTVPTSTDLVKDGATAIELLGDSIDASMNTALGTKKAGMVLLNTTSFSGVASQSFNDVFSSTYDHYFTICEIARSTSSNITFRMRVSGADDSGSNYIQQGLRAVGATVTGSTSTGTSGFFNNSASSTQYYGHQYFFKPFLATKTNLLSTSNSAEPVVGLIATEHQLTTSYTGFTLIASAGTITGTISIFGVNK